MASLSKLPTSAPYHPTVPSVLSALPPTIFSKLFLSANNAGNTCFRKLIVGSMSTERMALIVDRATRISWRFFKCLCLFVIGLHVYTRPAVIRRYRCIANCDGHPSSRKFRYLQIFRWGEFCNWFLWCQFHSPEVAHITPRWAWTVKHSTTYIAPQWHVVIWWTYCLL